MLFHGVMPAQLQDLMSVLTEFYQVPFGPLLQLAEVPLNTSPAYSPVYRLPPSPNHFTVIHKRKGTFHPIIQVNDENVKQYLHQYQPLKCITCKQLLIRLQAVHLCS